jgi:hypothetical protein
MKSVLYTLSSNLNLYLYKISKSSERESSGTTKGQLARLKKEVHSITQERDNALYKLERV